MTAAFPEDVPTAAALPPRSAHEPHRTRVRLARKWAYLVSENSYVPYSHAEVERAMLELVGALFDAVAAETVDVDAAAAVGARLVELNCVGSASLVSTVEVLTTAMLCDQETRRLDRLPERVGRLLGGLASGLAESMKRMVIEQQDALCRTLKTIAAKARQETEVRETEVGALSTELSLLRARLNHQLLHDALTGLPNRQYFATRLEQALGSGHPVTLYRLELSGFALINDGLGRLTGEVWLNAAAERFHRVVADHVTLVARLDDANFAILQESTPSTTDIAALVKRVNEALVEPTYLDNAGIATTASVGVVQSPPHRADAGALLHAADLALRAAKRAGLGRWTVHGPDADKEDRRLLRLATGMPGAWETGQLDVGYELRAALADDRPEGVHAFLQWAEDEPHPSPELAEQTGLAPWLSMLLLRTAADELRAGPDALTLTVSLTSAADLVPMAQNVLETSGLCPERLRIALPATELHDENLRRLAAAGVRTAVHGFEGGATELIQLAELPVDEVWLSERLVSQARHRSELTTDAVQSVIALVHRTAARVGVGDVRDRSEAEWWRRAGADLYSLAGAQPDIASLSGMFHCRSGSA
jgi:diguanylate cyclase (GGDEF)-like protein